MKRFFNGLFHLWYRGGLHVLCFTARIFYPSYPTAEELAPSPEKRRREAAERYERHLEFVAALRRERERSP